MSLTLTLPTSHISASSNSLLRSSGGVSSLIHTARVHSRLSQFGVSHESAGATELQHLKWVSNDPVYAPHGVTDAKLDINLDWAGVTSKEPQPMRADLALLRNKDVKWSSRAAGVEKQQQIKEWTQGNVCALSGKQHSFHHNRLRKKKKTGQEHLAPKYSVNLLWKYHVLQSDLSIVQLKMTGSVNKALEDLLKLPTWFYMNLWGACSSWNTEPRDCVVTDCWKWSRWSILSNRSSCAFTRNRTESQCRGEETCKRDRSGLEKGLWKGEWGFNRNSRVPYRCGLSESLSHWTALWASLTTRWCWRTTAGTHKEPGDQKGSGHGSFSTLWHTQLNSRIQIFLPRQHFIVSSWPHFRNK